MQLLFDESGVEGDGAVRPLADRMRPKHFSDVLGQEHLLGEGMMLDNARRSGQFPSIVFWGSPGCGKTTMARLIADETNARFVSLSAISSNTAELRKVFDVARADKQVGRQTVLLVDEIHRFNRSQQDLFLPYIEDGTIILIGATTENPSFELNAALLSRCSVLVLNRLSIDSLHKLGKRAEEFCGRELPLTEGSKGMLMIMADGDARYFIGLCEELFKLNSDEQLDEESLQLLLRSHMPVYDKSRDGHYNLISALHKSLRGSDPDAALYWMARMLDGGEDPFYILRRLVRFASEDIGLADPQALPQTIAAREAFHFLGSPEGDLAIAQAVVYLATAPKSNAVYMAHKGAVRDAKLNGSLMPPKHILNAPTALMKEQGYKEGYIYDHDTPEGFSGQDYFPEEMERKEYYHPVERGFEREVSKRLTWWSKIREQRNYKK